MKILDLSAGYRAIWYNKQHPECFYIDRRPEVKPDLVCDSRRLPEIFDIDYDLVVFDPPHMNCGAMSHMSKRYGYHTTQTILDTIRDTAREAFRVTKPEALMALKWNDHDIRLQRVFDLMPDWEPLFGHLTKDGPGSKTYWVMLKRISQSKITESISS